MASQQRGDLFVHAGLPRTGTTSMQLLLWTSSEQLVALGYEYARAAVDRRFGAHHSLAREIHAGGPGERADLLLAHLGGSEFPSTVISSEGFMLPLTPGPVEPLIAFLERCAELRSTHYVLTLRRMDDYFTSIYLHELKHGHQPAAPDTFVEEGLHTIDQLFERLAQLRDADVVDLRLPAYTRGSDPIHPTLAALGLEDLRADAAAIPRRGRRLGLKAQSLLGWVEEFDLITLGIEFDRIPLVHLFEDGIVELPDDVYDYDPLGSENRELLMRHGIESAQAHGFDSYVEAHPFESLEPRPAAPLSADRVAAADLESLAAQLKNKDAPAWFVPS